MRTLQEKYNGIQEGKFSKDQFLVEARQQLPNLVTRYNGYDDAVQILKNRGMIKEATSNTRKVGDKVSVYGTNNSTYIYSGEILSVDGDNVTVGKFSGAHPSTGEKSITVPSSRVKSGKDLSTNEAKLTKKSLTDYRYKPTNDMDKYPYEQILRGLRVELETLGVKDVPTAEEYTKALSKVSKNLEKDSIFYTNLVAGVNPKVDLHDKLVPVNQKQLFKTSVATPSKADGNKDTFNDLKKAQLKEGFRKLIKKVLTEGIESVGDKVDPLDDPKDPLHDYMESIEPKEEEVENYKKAAEADTLDESPAKNNPKIEKLVNGINDLIAKAVDIDGDPIGIVDTQSTWQEPEVYSPIEYRNGALKITSKSPYRSEVNTEVISSKRMGDDGIETLKYLMRKYKQAAKKAGTDLYPEKEDLDEVSENTNDIYSKPGLIVTGRTQVDNNAIGEVLDDLDLHGIWDVMEGCWFLPEDESTYDDLEEMLEQEFATRGINARFEGIFDDQNIIGQIDMDEAMDSGQDLVVFSIDSEDLDQILHTNFGTNLAYQDDRGDSLYTLPQDDFDRFMDYVTSLVGDQAEDQVNIHSGSDHWGNDADDISHPRGYEEASDAETEDDLYKETQSLSELLK